MKKIITELNSNFYCDYTLEELNQMNDNELKQELSRCISRAIDQEMEDDEC